MIRKGLLLDPHVRRNITLLKFISTVSLVLVALRRRLMRVPDIDKLIPPIQGKSKLLVLQESKSKVKNIAKGFKIKTIFNY